MARERRSLRLELATLLLFAALAALHTWPLASAPGRWSRNDNGDALLNEWTVAWVAHQLVTDPVRLYDGNIFYPERWTLAFSEHLIPQSLLVAPVVWAGGSPVLAFNLSLLAGFTLTGWAFSRLVRTWTGSWWAGAVAGSAAAFNAHTLTRLAHLQAMHLEFLPFALLALDRLFTSPRARHALALGGWFALQSLTSVYFLVFTAVSMVAASLARPGDWVGSRFRRIAPLGALAAAVAVLLLVPSIVPYAGVRRTHALARTLDEVGRLSATLGDYLATGARLHWGWSARFFHGNALFPGFVTLALAGTAVAARVAWRDKRARMWLVAGLVTFALSFGSALPGYGWLFVHLPLFDSIRAVVRFGQFALVSLAVLAGFGAAWWLGRVANRRIGRALGLALLVAVNAEAWRGPLAYTAFEGIPRLFRSLAREKGAVVACVPFYWLGAEVGAHGRYMLLSTANWLPMLNGYSGFRPASFSEHVEGLYRFPDPPTIAYLRKVGVTLVVVDVPALDGHSRDQLESVTDLALWASEGPYRVYRVR